MHVFREKYKIYQNTISENQKLIKWLPKWWWNRTFSRKSPLTNFHKLTPQITLLADFTHFEQPFSL